MIKIEGFNRQKNLGRFTEEAVGASVLATGEISSAEYNKDDKGKAVLSSGGNKQIKATVKVSKTENGKTFPQFLHFKYYEAGTNPKLSEIAPKKVGDKEVLKKVSFVFTNGGKEKTETEKGAFGSLDVYNTIKEGGKVSSGISVFGGNLKIAKKIEGSDSYFVDGFDGEKEVVEFNKGIRVTLKGVIEPIEDTETFLLDNYDKTKKTVKFNMYCFDTPKGEKSIPVVIDRVDEDMVKKVINKLKTNENHLVAVMGEYQSIAKARTTKSDSKSSDFGDYSASNTEYDYEAVIKVSYDEEKCSHKIKFFDKVGKLTIEKDLSDAKSLNGDKPKDEWVF